MARVAYVEWKSGRVVAGLLVITAHIALILLLSRPSRHEAGTAEVVFVSLPITLEDPPEETSTVATRPETPPDTPEQQRSARASQAPTSHGTESSPPLPTIVDTPGAAPESPAPQIDWHAELTTAARSAEQRARIESERRTLSGLAQSPMQLPARKPTCPFERCEPGWDSPPGIFPHSKAGRVEKNSDGEVIRWISERCYQTLVTNDIFHRAMTRCQRPLDKNEARGDLFDHMRDVPPPTEKALDVP